MGKFLGLSYETEYAKILRLSLLWLKKAKFKTLMHEVVNIVYDGKIFKVKVSEAPMNEEKRWKSWVSDMVVVAW